MGNKLSDVLYIGSISVVVCIIGDVVSTIGDVVSTIGDVDYTDDDADYRIQSVSHTDCTAV